MSALKDKLFRFLSPPDGDASESRFIFRDKKDVMIFCIVAACIAIIGNWFLFYYENKEVVWETHGFWVRYNNIYQSLLNNPAKAVTQTIMSITTQDYNYLSIWPLLVFRFFSDSRLVFFLSVFNMYALPAAVMFIAFFAWFRASFVRMDEAISLFAVPAAVILFIPPFWVPILTGYVDVALMTFSCACFVLWLRKPASSQSFGVIVGIGILLAAGVLFRRPYLIWVLSFLCMIGLDVITDMAVTFRDRMLALLKVAMVGISFAAVMLIIAWPLVQHMISYDYAESYSAYKMQDTVVLMLLDFYKYFGSFFTFLFIAGVVTAVGRQSSSRTSLLLLFQAVLTFVIFHSIQDFGPYHYYLLLPIIALFASEFVLFLLQKYSGKRPLLVVAYGIAVVFFFGGVFLPVTGELVNPVRSVLAIRKNYPVVRTDIPELERMVDTLWSLVQGTEDKIYVLADSNTLQDRTLLFASYALGRPIPLEKNVVGTALVDKRDGFSKYFFDAKYVVVGSPVWHTLKSVDQKVLMLPAQHIIKGTGIGKAYDKIPVRFMLDRKTRVYIYKRVRPFEKKALEELSEELKATYPDRPDIYELPIRDELIQQ